MPTALSPRKLTDLADCEVMPHFIEQMRESKDLRAVPMELCEYAADYLRNVPVVPAHVEALAIFVADHTYRFSAQATMVDHYVHAYFYAVTRFLWDCIHARGVRLFYVLDNTIREDRFKLAYDLFLRSGVAVVTPYDWNPSTWDLVERDLRVHLVAGRHIAYIEKDASVNYLDRVLEMARRSLHTTVLRNRAPDDPAVTRMENEPPTVS